MKTWEKMMVIVEIAAVAFLTAWIIYTNQIVQNQERQIDQICQMVFELAREQGATDETGFTYGAGKKEYCFFFADYSRNLAILGEFDGEISYDKKPRLVIMHNVDEKNLEYWSKQPIPYERYKKIPR
jgi:hypothetical protein